MLGLISLRWMGFTGEIRRIASKIHWGNVSIKLQLIDLQNHRIVKVLKDL